MIGFTTVLENRWQPAFSDDCEDRCRYCAGDGSPQPESGSGGRSIGTEPGRLWRRYLRNNPSFMVRIVRHPPRLVV